MQMPNRRDRLARNSNWVSAMDDTLLLFAALAPLAAVVGSIWFMRWRKEKGRASIFASDTSLEMIGLSAAMNVGSGEVVKCVDGRTELRPPFGTRIIGPLVAMAVLLFMDWTPLFGSVGLTDPRTQGWVIAGLFGLLGYTAFQLNFRQKVVFDDRQIESHGVQLRPQVRNLSGLVDIAVHPKREALVLTFADQPPLYLPKFLTGRDRFVAQMQQIAEDIRTEDATGP